MLETSHPPDKSSLEQDGSERRPIGIPTFEDQILQRAVTMVPVAVYETEFLDCSYGFRPRRSAHQALQVLRDGVMAMLRKRPAGVWLTKLMTIR